MFTHPQRLTDAGITHARHEELQWICRQYPEYLRKLADARAGNVDKPMGRSSAWKRPDPVGNAAARIADDTWVISRRVAIIEQSAKDVAAPVVARALLRNVTERLSYDALRPPIGEKQFYDARMAFFVLLDRRLLEAERPGKSTNRSG